MNPIEPARDLDVSEPARISLEETMTSAADKVSELADQAAATAQDVARKAGRQANAVAESVYGQGGDLIEVIEGAIRGNPIGSVLLAAAVGYGIARFSHRR